MEAEKPSITCSSVLANQLYRNGDFLRSAAMYQALNEAHPTGRFEYNYNLSIEKFLEKENEHFDPETPGTSSGDFFSRTNWLETLYPAKRFQAFENKEGIKPLYIWGDSLSIPPNLLESNIDLSVFFDVQYISAEKASGARLEIKQFKNKEVIHTESLLAPGMSHVFNLDKAATHLCAGIRITGKTKLHLNTIYIRKKLQDLSDVASYGCVCIAPAYPSSEDRYRYAFVHTRVKEYILLGFKTLVVTRSPSSISTEYFFEGVRVLSLSDKDILGMLKSIPSTPLAIHSPSPDLQDLLGPLLYNRKITFWAHGVDYQPWFFRHSLVRGPNHRVRYRATSQRRALMWRRIIENINLDFTIVFVSHYQAAQFNCQIACLENVRYAVIPNPIDTDVFQYIEKPLEQSRKILSIRPYHSNIYANDISAKALIELSKKSYFHDLFFAFIGDGPLFDDILGPFVRLPNVLVLRRFLSTQQISLFHKQFGLFLTPSRMDTHGVSRDEAMSSGLVPVTTSIAAIPEFVDNNCGILVPPEDFQAIAKSIEDIFLGDKSFTPLSLSSSDRIRRTTSKYIGLPAELEIIKSGGSILDSDDLQKVHIAIYGDLNLNIMDGSSTWLASFAQALGSYGTNLILHIYSKACILNIEIVLPLLELGHVVRIIEPSNKAEPETASHAEIIKYILENDKAYKYDAFVFRGYDFCCFGLNYFSGRNVIAYVTDIPQTQSKLIQSKVSESLQSLICGGWRIGIQTDQMRQFLASNLSPDIENRCVMIYPSIPDSFCIGNHRKVSEGLGDKKLNIVYAGKFAIPWCVNELIDSLSVEHIRQNFRVFVFGDKFHKYSDHPKYGENLSKMLTSTEGVYWETKLSREQLRIKLLDMEVSWCFRDPLMEASSLELSTKVIEFCALGIVPVLYPNTINIELLGAGYPYFAGSLEEAYSVMQLISCDFKSGAVNSIRNSIQDAATKYSHQYVAPVLLKSILFC